jgi:hypothetical protein
MAVTLNSLSLEQLIRARDIVTDLMLTEAAKGNFTEANNYETKLEAINTEIESR